jgi:hypothetical protein
VIGPEIILHSDLRALGIGGRVHGDPRHECFHKLALLLERQLAVHDLLSQVAQQPSRPVQVENPGGVLGENLSQLR